MEEQPAARGKVDLDSHREPGMMEEMKGISPGKWEEKKESLSTQIIIKPGAVIHGGRRAPLAGRTAASRLSTPRAWRPPDATKHPCSKPLCVPGPDNGYRGDLTEP